MKIVDCKSWMYVLCVVAFGGMMALPVGGASSVYAAEKPHGEALSLLIKAHAQLEIAKKYAELALTPYQPGTGWHSAHIQRAMNVLSGKGGPDFNDKVENPGDGHGVINYLKDGHDAMKGCRPVETCEALESALIYIEEALKHGRQAIKTEHRHGLAQRQARLFGALLEAAHGRRDTNSPILGALDFAIRGVERESYK